MPTNPTKQNPQIGAGPGNQPKWWTDQHTQNWDRIKDQQRKDWESASAASSGVVHADTDMSKHKPGAQAGQTGAQTGTPGTQVKWNDAESAMRYGHGAQSQYGKEHHEWNDSLEGKLKQEWLDLKSGKTWQEVKDAVRRGFESGRRKG